jgi:hypothetical protein
MECERTQRSVVAFVNIKSEQKSTTPSVRTTYVHCWTLVEYISPGTGRRRPGEDGALDERPKESRPKGQKGLLASRAEGDVRRCRRRECATASTYTVYIS